jgi:Leucine-rich repeat (LRR) protein
MTTFKRTITRINKNDKKLTEVDIELERDSKKFFKDDYAIELAAALGKNTVVRTLKLQCTSRVRSVGWNAIAELINTSTVLTSIQLTYQFFLFDDLVVLLTAVGKNPNITSLTIGRIDLFKIQEQICIGKLLGTIVETTTKLQTLDLGYNELDSSELVDAFLPSLIGNKSIHNLNFSYCNLPVTGIIVLNYTVQQYYPMP